MFDFDGAKLIIIGIVALIVIKPKDLPGVLRQVGQAVAQLRRMAAEFQGQFTEAMREADLHEMKKDIEKMTKVDLDGLDPFDTLRGDIESTKAEIDAHLNTPQSPPPEMQSVDAPVLEAQAEPVQVQPAHIEATPVEHAAHVHRLGHEAPAVDKSAEPARSTAS